ncbi:MAG: hypothetical protein JKY88_13965 [Pseudomonadales bacterium]|nr:hypothetical protein [Pseudomonadales bacterium]
MNKGIFYLSFAYFFTTRLVSPLKMLSWIAIYPVPILIAIVLFTGDLSWEIILTAILGMCATYTLYELGYLQNDASTIIKEKNPTIRLEPSAILYVRNRWIGILVCRLFLCGILVALIRQFNPAGFEVFLMSLLIIALTFLIYNELRSWINVPLHFLLVCGRFCGPALLIIPDPAFLAYLVFIFPLINLLERGAEPRYNLSWLQDHVLSNQTSGRWIYYLVISITWPIICMLFSFNLVTTLIFVYLFFYRLISPALLR